MAFRYIAGPNLNHLTRAANAPSMSPAALAGFPATNAYDNRSSRPAVFGTASSESTFTVDLNLIAGSDFETASDITYWTTLGNGSVVHSTSDSWSGDGSMIVDNGVASQAIAYQDVQARAGEELNFYGATSGAESYIRIRNRQTGNWLDTAGDWQATEQYVVASTDSNWHEGFVYQFAVEDLATCITDTVTLRVYLHTKSFGAGAYDQIELYPSISWVSVHGHNVPPYVTLLLDGSADGASWAEYDTFTQKRDSFVYVTANDYYRYWRLRFDGYPDGLMYMGEVVFGQHRELLHNPIYGGTLRWQEQQTRIVTDYGEPFVQLHNQLPQRTLLLNFTHHGSTEYEQFHKELFRASRGGGNVICVQPVEMDSDVVVLGRVRDTVEILKHTPYERSTSLEIAELPLPNVTEIATAYDTPVST